MNFRTSSKNKWLSKKHKLGKRKNLKLNLKGLRNLPWVYPMKKFVGHSKSKFSVNKNLLYQVILL